MSRTTLPSELWNNVARYCRRRDIRSLARANKKILYAARSVLFEKLVIEQRGTQSNPALFNLLQKDRALCASVKHIKVVTQWSGHNSWISVEFLRRFIHADSIYLEGWPFGEDEEEHKACLEFMCSGQWKSFGYNENLRKNPDFDAMGWGRITGLQKVSLRGTGIIGRVSSFLRASATTLTHLTLPSEMFDYDAAALEGLLSDSVKFPNLYFFECGGYKIGEDMSLPWDILNLVTRFLSRHPTIQHLRIPCDDGYCTVGSHCTLDSAWITPDFLPSLKKLDAHIDAIEKMALHDVKSLASLQEVITGDWSHFGPMSYDSQDEDGTELLEHNVAEGIQSMSRFLVTLLQHGGLPGVKRFTMTVGPKCDAIDYPRLTVDQMGMMAKVLPSVEEWTGNGNGLDDATEKTLGDMFKAFSTLKTIRLRGMEVDRGAMRAIARVVPTLDSVHYEDLSDRRDDEWLTFDVIRLTNNRIVFSDGVAVSVN